MIEQLIGSGILVALGAGGMWAVMRSRLVEAEASADRQCEQLLRQLGHTIRAERAHSRLSDAHNSTKERIERALECETPGANATVKRMARILRGEQPQ